MKKLYIGNLSYQTSEGTLRGAFEKYASVVSVKIINDKFSGQSRGFGFIEMSDGEEASRAISEMNGSMLDGKSLKVNEARPQNESSGGGGGYGRSRDGGGYGRSHDSDGGRGKRSSRY